MSTICLLILLSLVTHTSAMESTDTLPVPATPNIFVWQDNITSTSFIAVGTTATKEPASFAAGDASLNTPRVCDHRQPPADTALTTNNLTKQDGVHGTTTPFFIIYACVEKESAVPPPVPSSATWHGAASVMELAAADGPTAETVPVKARGIGAATSMMAGGTTDSTLDLDGRRVHPASPRPPLSTRAPATPHPSAAAEGMVMAGRVLLAADAAWMVPMKTCDTEPPSADVTTTTATTTVTTTSTASPKARAKVITMPAPAPTLSPPTTSTALAMPLNPTPTALPLQAVAAAAAGSEGKVAVGAAATTAPVPAKTCDAKPPSAMPPTFTMIEHAQCELRPYHSAGHVGACREQSNKNNDHHLSATADTNSVQAAAAAAAAAAAGTMFASFSAPLPLLPCSTDGRHKNSSYCIHRASEDHFSEQTCFTLKAQTATSFPTLNYTTNPTNTTTTAAAAATAAVSTKTTATPVPTIHATDKYNMQAASSAAGSVLASFDTPVPLLPSCTGGWQQHYSYCIHRASEAHLSERACFNLKAHTATTPSSTPRSSSSSSSVTTTNKNINNNNNYYYYNNGSSSSTPARSPPLPSFVDQIGYVQCTVSWLFQMIAGFFLLPLLPPLPFILYFLFHHFHSHHRSATRRGIHTIRWSSVGCTRRPVRRGNVRQSMTILMAKKKKANACLLPQSDSNHEKETSLTNTPSLAKTALRLRAFLRCILGQHKRSWRFLIAVLCAGQLATAASQSVKPILVDFDPSLRFCGELPDDVPLTWELYQKGPDHYAETVTCIPGDFDYYFSPHARIVDDLQGLLEINGYKRFAPWEGTAEVVLGSLPNLVFIDHRALDGVKSVEMAGDYPKLKEIRKALNGVTESISINGSFPALEIIDGGISLAPSIDVVMRDLHSLSQVINAFGIDFYKLMFNSRLFISKGSVEFVGGLPKLTKMQQCFEFFQDDPDRLARLYKYANRQTEIDVDINFTITTSLPSYVGCSDYSGVGAGVLGPPGTVPLTKALHSKGQALYKAATCILPNAFANVSDDVVLTAETVPNLRAVSYNAFPESYTGALTFAGDFQFLVHLDMQSFQGGNTESAISLGSCPKLGSLFNPARETRTTRHIPLYGEFLDKEGFLIRGFGRAGNPGREQVNSITNDWESNAGLQLIRGVHGLDSPNNPNSFQHSFVGWNFSGSVDLPGPFPTLNLHGSCGHTLVRDQGVQWFPLAGAGGYVPLTQALYATGSDNFSPMVTCVNLLAFQGYAGNVALGSLPELVVFEAVAQHDGTTFEQKLYGQSRTNVWGRMSVKVYSLRAFDGLLSIDGDYPKLKVLAGQLGIYNKDYKAHPWNVSMRSLFALEAVSGRFFWMSVGSASLAGPFKSYKGPCMCTTGSDLHMARIVQLSSRGHRRGFVELGSDIGSTIHPNNDFIMGSFVKEVAAMVEGAALDDGGGGGNAGGNNVSWDFISAIPPCVPVSPEGELALEPRLYDQGPDVYDKATCVPAGAFLLGSPQMYELGSMPKLKSIGAYSFASYYWRDSATDRTGGNVVSHPMLLRLTDRLRTRIRIENAAFPLLEQIGEYAFHGAGLRGSISEMNSKPTSSDNLIQFGSLPSLQAVGQLAFFNTGNVLTFAGDYPALQIIGSMAFSTWNRPGSGAGYNQFAQSAYTVYMKGLTLFSKIKMASLEKLRFILDNAFFEFQGILIFSGYVKSLKYVGARAFPYVSSEATIEFYSKDCEGIRFNTEYDSSIPYGLGVGKYRSYCSRGLSIARLGERFVKGDKYTEYTDPTGTPLPTYIAGETYRIAPFKLDVDESIFTWGDESDITYTLSGQKETIDNWFISASTGIILGGFDEPGNYTFSVDVVDGGGKQGVLETHNLEVISPPTFTVQKYEHVVPTDLEAGAYAFVESSNDTMSNDLDRQPGDHVQRPYFGVRRVATGTAGLSYQTVYAGVSVRLPPIVLVEYESGGARYTQETPRTEAITFTIEDQPRGFFIDPATSEILGSPSLKLSTDEDGSESNVRTATIYAVNAAQEKAFVEQIRFTVVEQDVSVDTNGPRNRTCANGGVKVDGTKFDGKFTCDCSSTPYVDENCETAIACNRSQTLDVQTCIDFKLDYDTSVRATASDDYTEPSNMVGTYYAVGQTYLISPFKLRKNSTTPSVGTFDELQYALDGSLPNGMFLKPKSGEIQVSFSEKDANTIYNVDVDVVDKGGARITIDVLDFPVRYRDVEDPFNKDAFGPNNTACKNGGVPIDNENEFDEKYYCNCDSTGFSGLNCKNEIKQVTACPNKNSTLVGDTCKVFELDVNKKARKRTGTEYTDPATMSATYYAVGESYRLSTFALLNTTKPSVGIVADIRYTLEGAPDGFFLSTTSGEVFWQFGPPDSGTNYSVVVKLVAVDQGSARQVVETLAMNVAYKDVDVPDFKHGPNSRECAHNGIPTDNENMFDGRYTCTCQPGWIGDNCEDRAKCCQDDQILIVPDDCSAGCTECLFDSVPSEDQTECEVQECKDLEDKNVCVCDTSDLTAADSGFVNIVCDGTKWPPSIKGAEPLVLPQSISQLSFTGVKPSRLAFVLNESVANSTVDNIIVNQDAFGLQRLQNSSAASAVPSNRTAKEIAASASRSISAVPECSGAVPSNIATLDLKVGIEKICDAGYYADISNNGVCTPCERGGFYGNTKGRVGESSHCACSACQNGTWSQSAGSSSQVCDVCPQGTTRDSAAQYRACPCLNDWSRKDRFGECESCEGKLGIECSGDARVLKAGYYWKFPDSDTEQEYIRFTENLAKSFDFDRNLTVFSGAYPKAYVCPGGNKTCLGFNAGMQTSSNCAEGTDGVKCAVCAEDHFRMNGGCTVCPANLGGSIAVMIVIVLVFVGLLYWVFKRNAQDVPFIGAVKDKVESAFDSIDLNNDGTVSKEELAAELQKPGGELATMLEDAGINTAVFVLEQIDGDKNGNINVNEFKVALQSSTQRCISCFTMFATNKCKFHDHEQVNFMTMAKIIISFTQVKSLLVEVYPGAPWPDSYRSATSALQFLSSNPLSVMMPSCMSSSLIITSYAEMIMSSVAPLVLAPLIWAYYMISSRCSNDLKQLQAVCISTASFAFYLLYPTITVSAVRVLAECDIICTDEAETENCISYLRADYSIVCGTGAKEVHAYSDVHKKYRAVAAVSFVVYAIIAPIAIGWKIRLNKHARKDEQRKAEANGVGTDAVGMSAFVAGLSFYAAPYRKGFYLWETADLFRKLLLVSIIVFIADGTSLQLAVGVVFAVGGLVLQLMYKPFLHPSENALAAVSQGILALSLVVGGLLRASKAETAAMMESGDIDSFVAGVYMITSGALLYVIALAIWFGNPLACLCHSKGSSGETGNSQDPAVESNPHFVAVSETRFDANERKDSKILVFERAPQNSDGSDGSDSDDGMDL